MDSQSIVQKQSGTQELQSELDQIRSMVKLELDLDKLDADNAEFYSYDPNVPRARASTSSHSQSPLHG